MPKQPAQQILSASQIQQYAYDAGFRGDALRWSVAIALAESGGNPGAYNPEIAAGTRPGSGSRGLWQIYGAAHPQYNSSLTFDPVVNARAAFNVYREAGYKFTPWSAFTKHTADAYYKTLKLPAPRENGGAVSAGVLGVIGGIGGNNPGSLGTAGGIALNPAVQAGIGGVTGGLSQGNPAQVAAIAAQSAQTTAGALQDIASGKFIENIFSKFDKVSFTFYIAGIIIMVIGLLVIFARPATELVIQGTKAAATSGISAAL